ncbi:MAG: bifunctional UDP-N-acetylglucosamine diphosphorylase/glucosamine-1-phosphate N-acetyltransferase GlmU [Magnetococcales bacterium]|nr:bifunctional UDP-N-acetylglucosamine diphosphorylase/glucosamine-1-phosphate N-acetyltransferase GlmU [Magnetococcales bacterium]
MNRCSVLVLAAGQGTRMRSRLPKVLHRLAGRPLLWHILRAVRGMRPDHLAVVTGFGADLVERELAAPDIHWVRQEERRGTGHAVMCALPVLEGLSGELLILNGDHPLVETGVLEALLEEHRREGNLLTLLSTVLEKPDGYGRVVRDARGGLARIVEEKDADAAVRALTEVNTGFYCVDVARLAEWLAHITDQNAQNEYYLPDIVPLAIAEGRVGVLRAADAVALSGVNDRAQLAGLEVAMRARLTARFMAAGVTFVDPASCWLAADVEIGPDTVIEPQVMLGPGSVVGEGCHIGPFCRIQESLIGSGTRVHAFCHLDGAVIEGASEIGPYARLRPGTQLASRAKVGNFCELKKAVIGEGSKVNHLSYIGDAEVGSGVNVGAGTITCNYDGVHKHRTVIEDHVFVGSDVQFVAPVRVGAGATIGAGTTVTRDVPAAALAVSRTAQTHIERWAEKKARFVKKDP